VPQTMSVITEDKTRSTETGGGGGGGGGSAGEE
jgi:hypothetical protein